MQKIAYLMYMAFEQLGKSDTAWIIAEIGKNFIQTEEDKTNEEYLQNAKALIDAACDTGVDAIKFQTHEVEDEQMNIEVVSPHFSAKDRYSWIERNSKATPLEFWKEIKEYCDEKGVIFFSAPMSRKAAQKLENIDPPLWKVGSGDVQDYLLLNELIRTKKPIIISSGMVGLEELDEVVHYLTKSGTQLAILYCISQYPCPPEHFNLATIEYLKEKYPNVAIGFSDHSIGYDVALAAVKVGANIIEKHFTLSRDFWGPDHKVSMAPAEMKEMVRTIRNNDFKDIDVSPFYGEKNKELEGATNQFRPYFNKKLIAGRDISKGETLLEDMLFAMRPAKEIQGFPANQLPDILGKTIAKDLNKYDPISPESLI